VSKKKMYAQEDTQELSQAIRSKIRRRKPEYAWSFHGVARM